MRRREFITGLGSLAALPATSHAQQASRPKRIGILAGYDQRDPILQSWISAFLTGLATAGWNDGGNAVIRTRWVFADPAQLRAHAAELADLSPDVLFATPHTAAQAIHELTTSIPIVIVQSGDFVSAGFARSQARPGGNMTGFMLFEHTIVTKHLELLKLVVPHLTRVAVLQSESSSWRGDFGAVAAVATSVGIEATSVLIHEPADIERQITAFAATPNGALICPPDGFIGAHHPQIIALVAKYRLPTIYSQRGALRRGGLMIYGSDSVDIYRRAADYVDRILRGERPANLPVQSPIKFELGINVKTARDMGLAIPEALLATADEVLE